jgi:flavin reductase (DIM6/NTAB) family NADH-FMN oxidoreductase RutF
MATFRDFDWRTMSDNVWRLIGDEWMLVTAGSLSSWNAMTASWGGFGHLWNMDVVFAFVRPTRHTHGFMEGSEGFTLSFFNPERRDILHVCGSTSGRDTDKAKAAGITPRAFSSLDVPERVSFEEARLIFSCRKVHAQDLDPAGFIDPTIAANYTGNDFHRLYVGAIEAAWETER